VILDWFAGSLAILVIVWTLLPLLHHEVWWIRVFDFPRIQVCFIALLVLLAFIGLDGWQGWFNLAVIASLMSCLFYQLICILPYTRLWPKQLKASADKNPDSRLSLFSANVLTPNRRAADLIAQIRQADPDVILTVETDNWWESKLDSLQDDYPYAVKHPLDNLYGMHLYSRLELVDPKIAFLVEQDKPSIHARVMLRSGHPVQLICLHPAPPSPSENPTSQERDAELVVIAKNIDATANSVVVIGDLNDVAWSATTALFQKISGLLDPRVGRGFYNTFHADLPFLRWPLDHVFCSSDFTLSSLTRLRKFGSDHFPFHVVLCHSPAAELLHETPAAAQSDHS
jgi:endonuclease/exonuclease/phosphatase (EEP) superfamily protein YafD